MVIDELQLEAEPVEAEQELEMVVKSYLPVPFAAAVLVAPFDVE